MIQSFVDWIRALLLISFVVTLVQSILPDNTLRPFVRLVLGFVVLAVLMNPMIHLIENPAGWRNMFNQVLLQPTTASTDHLIRLGREIELRGMQAAVNQLSLRLGQQIEALVTLLEEVDEATVDVVNMKDDEIQTVIMTLRGEPDPGEEHVKQLVFKYFGIPKSAVVTKWTPREGE